MQMPLERLKVLDLTQVMAGPFCCQQLADLGAEVIKIEPPESGEQTRRAMGFTMKGDDTAAFLAINRNKKSLTLNLKEEEGRKIFHRLTEEADIVVENYRPGVTERLGIDYPTLREINPGLIYASVSGFGQTGPYAGRGGYDLIAQGMSGLMSVTGHPDGTPVKCGVPVSDLAAGLFCTVGILSALEALRETGQGQHIDTSLFEGALALSVWETAELWAMQHVPQPFGSAHRLAAPYQALQTSDGYITVAANNQRLWARLCSVIGREDLLEDKRFAANMDRMEHIDELTEELETAFAGGTTQEWVDSLLEQGVPAGPIYNYQEVFEDPHTEAREMMVEMEHPVEGTVKGLGIPMKLSETPGKIRRPAPLVGQHSDEVLAEIGYGEQDVAALRERQII